MSPGNAVAPWLAVQTRQLLAQNGHAWLLHGPSGLGQYGLALSLASAWLCEQPTEEGACGQCGSCHAIDVRTHADLAVLMPETALIERGWPLGEKAQAEIDDKKRKASREIRVEAMRETIAVVAWVTPWRGLRCPLRLSGWLPKVFRQPMPAHCCAWRVAGPTMPCFWAARPCQLRAGRVCPGLWRAGTSARFQASRPRRRLRCCRSSVTTC
jgi:hypothetical protein